MSKKGPVKAVAIGLTVILIMGVLATWAAAEGNSEQPASYFEMLDPYVASYNENISSIPDLAKRAFDGERINVHIALAEGEEEVIGVATSKGECAITEFSAGGLDKPTLRVYIEGSVIESHISNPVQDEIVDTVLNLKVEGVGLVNQAKVFVFGLFQKIARMFV